MPPPELLPRPRPLFEELAEVAPKPPVLELSEMELSPPRLFPSPCEAEEVLVVTEPAKGCVPAGVVVGKVLGETAVVVAGPVLGMVAGVGSGTLAAPPTGFSLDANELSGFGAGLFDCTSGGAEDAAVFWSTVFFG